MHDQLLRPDPELHTPHGGSGRAGLFALRGVLMGWMALVSCIALADVYTEVNDKINASQWSAAQTLIDRQLQKQPADPQIRLMQSQMQTAQGQTAQAIATLQGLTQEFPELPEPYNNLAVLYAGQQRFDEALTALTLAVRARPDYSLALENLGDVHIALARQAYLKAKNLPAQGPLIGTRLESKIQLSGQLLQPTQP
jgi:tetratricopeptide (TPR) repeat protein